MRRRSTLHWATSNPRARQSKLEAVEVNRLVTSWFSIHHEALDQPLYISEVMENSMNPTFSFFDLDPSIANVARSDNFVLRVWSKNELVTDYRILVELRINLRSLQFVGRSLETFHHPLPENCVLLHLSDGIYTSFTDLPAEGQQQLPLTTAMKALAPVQAASFDALIKLANLDDVIQDALRTRVTLEADINKLLAKMPHAEHALSELSSKREEARHTRRALEAEQKSLDQFTKSRTELTESLRRRKEMMQNFSSAQTKGEEIQKQVQMVTSKIHRELDGLIQSSNGQARRICTSLLQIFPIEPVKNRALQFSIRNIHLPNSVFHDTNRDEITAALGFTAQLVRQLSLYLSVHLPYPIEAVAPNCSIRDDISASIAQREFPLQPVGAAYKFEYGVFLLNKDIEFLMNRSGLRVMDIRHTLPNLKYLMFVLTTGSGELPSRKAGGVRGLLRSTPSISRWNSEESVTGQNNHAGVEGKRDGAYQNEKVEDGDDIFHAPVMARGLPYRKSMLRDAG